MSAQRACTAALAFLCLATDLQASEPKRTPNIVLIFADDLGYGDLGCYGAKGWSTPNLDRMAREGVRFTDFYVSQPVCSASRASLLTGCYANRVGIAGALKPEAKVGISSSETTIAELCKARGYATSMVGKWHLGHLPQFLPTRHGFDAYLGLPYSNDMWPHRPDLKPGTYPGLPLLDGEKVINPDVTAADQAMLTTQYTERAVAFIASNKSKPFFLYLAHSMPHVPLFVNPQRKGKSTAGLYGDVIQEIDWSVGQILGALKVAGIDDNTLLLFTSDNGPWLSYGNHGGSAGALREGKGTVWEGGVREPFLARWPGTIAAGTVCREPAMTIDILPTVATLIGAELPKQKIDGLDIWPLVAGVPGARCPHEALYFYYQQNELQALRSGRWKLMLPHTYRTMQGQQAGKDGTPGKYRNLKIAQPELYDLGEDSSETLNVAAKHPGELKMLMGLAEAMRGELGDSLSRRVGTGRREPGRAGQ